MSQMRTHRERVTHGERLFEIGQVGRIEAFCFDALIAKVGVDVGVSKLLLVVGRGCKEALCFGNCTSDQSGVDAMSTDIHEAAIAQCVAYRLCDCGTLIRIMRKSADIDDRQLGAVGHDALTMTAARRLTCSTRRGNSTVVSRP